MSAFSGLANVLTNLVLKVLSKFINFSQIMRKLQIFRQITFVSFYSLRSRQEAKMLFMPLTHPMTKCHILICRFSSGCGYCIDIQLLRAYTVNCGTKKL